jgi:succinate dehydrogenase / fumarate reductase membrane anchor subunit
MSVGGSGVRNWVAQRLSAVYLGGFVIAAVICLLVNPVQDYQSWRELVGNPVFNLAFLLFWLALLVHAWIGVRDVMLDYIKPVGLRFSLLAAFGIFLLGMMAWVAKVLLTVTA